MNQDKITSIQFIKKYANESVKIMYTPSDDTFHLHIIERTKTWAQGAAIISSIRVNPGIHITAKYIIHVTRSNRSKTHRLFKQIEDETITDLFLESYVNYQPQVTIGSRPVSKNEMHFNSDSKLKHGVNFNEFKLRIAVAKITGLIEEQMKLESEILNREIL